MKSMLHLNNHLLCAIDIRTTGPNFQEHEILQVAFLPLDSELQPNKGLKLFFCDLKPDNADQVDYEKSKLCKTDIANFILRGIDPLTAADMVYEWFQKLNLAYKKVIVPLSHNWPFVRDFLIRWMGRVQYDLMFHETEYRDPMAAALFLNDRADFMAEKFVFNKTKMRWLCTQLNVEYERTQDPLCTCKAIAEIYRKIVKGQR